MTAARSPTSAAPSPRCPRPAPKCLLFKAFVSSSSSPLYVSTTPAPPWADQPYPRGLEKREKLPSTLPELLSHPWAREARPGGAPFMACPLHVCGPPACSPTLLLGLVSEIHHWSPETKPRPHQGSEGSSSPASHHPRDETSPHWPAATWLLPSVVSAPSHPGVPTQYSFPPASF